MKKRILAMFLALGMGVSALAGCNSDKDELEDLARSNEELKQVIYDLSQQVAELREMYSLPAGSLTEEGDSLSDEEGMELTEQIEVHEMNLLAASTPGTQVKARDWSQYTSESAKSRLSEAEEAFYDRLYESCELYLNDPSHVTTNDRRSYISSTVLFSDLGLTKEQRYAVFFWFKYNNPQFYFLQSYTYTSTTMYITIYDFVMALPDQAATTNEMFDKLDSWIAECSDNEVTDWDKITSANKKICESIIYSPDVKANVEGAGGGKNQSMYSVLMSDDTVCAGYALAFEAMANAMGIDTYTVLSDTHAWNAAEFRDGNYYYVDVCWNDLNNEQVCNENFIGVGTDYANYRDNGTQSHVMNSDSVAYGPTIPRGDYQGDNNTELSAPSLRVSGSGSSMVKVEWDAVANAQKYEYSVFDSITVYSRKTTENNFMYVSLPDETGSADVKVRAVAAENGKDIYSQYSQITVSPNNLGSDISKPANIKTELMESSFRVSWDEDSGAEGWLFVAYEDSTLTKPWFCYTLEASSVGWKSWLPEKDNYFSIMSIKKSGNTEIYSDPVHFKYNINDGMQLIQEDNASSGNSGNSEIVTKEFSTGTYVGEMKDGKLEGHGKMTWTDGSVYEGEWKDSKYNGQGKLTRTSGNVYEGEFKDGKYNGQGKLTYASGTVYEGEFKDGTYDGQGKLTYASGTVYEGEFKDGKYNGQGTETYKWPSGDVRVRTGTFKDGKFNGQGTQDYTWPSGNTAHYEGTFVDGKYNGQGIRDYMYSNGNTTHYEGTFVDDEFNGQGTETFKWPSGDVRVRTGTFKDGKLNGQGTQDYTWADGVTAHYEGTFVDGEFYNGIETTYNTDGSVRSTKTYSGNSGNSEIVTKEFSTGTYVGEMKDGKLEGHGKMTWTDGSVYEGEWKDSKYNGQGKLTRTSGNVYEGEFKDGKYNGQGKLTYASGNVYEGEFKDGTYDGQGTETYKWSSGNVRVQTGTFKDGKLNGQGTEDYMFSNGDTAHYEGTFVDGKFDGQGVRDYMFSNGVTTHYEGTFVDSKYNGQGTETTEWPSGNVRVQTGMFKDGKINGQGTEDYTFSNGDTSHYEGTFVDGKFNGQGIRDYTGGSTSHYEGTFADGKFNGQGTETIEWPSGNVRVQTGTFKDGKLNGQGTQDYTWTNGVTAHYEGTFVDSEYYNGIETVYNADGSVRYTKTYVNGQVD